LPGAPHLALEMWVRRPILSTIIRMPKKSKQRIPLSDNVVGWIGVAAVLAALFILDKPDHPHKWHAAIVWTASAFSVVALFGRTRWRSWRFWMLCAVFLVLHVFTMWVIFAKVFPNLVLGTLYVVPPAFVEGILLLGVVVRIERRLSPMRRSKS
jgi:hypothetical protein